MRGHSAIRPTRVEIDLEALRHNARVLGHVAGTRVFAVVKADGYGHGAEAVARALEPDRAVAGFAVSLVEEGCRLRDAGVSLPILIMGPSLDGGYDEIVSHRLTAILSDAQDLEGLSRAAARAGRSVAAHLKIDTGLGRLGIVPDRLGAFVDRLDDLGHVAIKGLCTHFACADTDDPDDPACMTHDQLRRFDGAVNHARALGLAPALLHAANSAATLRFAGARRDLVRCGLALYGNGEKPRVTEAFAAAGGATLRQVMRLVSYVAQVREVRAGAPVSYGALWRAPRDSRLAVLPIGYADGVPRSVTGKAEVLIAGRRCPLVGAVSMDIAIADITALDSAVSVGDEAVLLGRQQGDAISTAEFAAWAGLLEYEVTCGVSKRVPRFHVTQEQTR